MAAFALSAPPVLSESGTGSWIAQLESNDWILQADALAQMEASGSAEAVEPIRKLLTSEASAYVRARALLALARLKPEAARQAALTAASEGESAMRVAGLMALGLIGEPAGVDIAAKAVNDSDPAVQRAGIEAYARLQGAKAAPLLTNRLRSDDEQIAVDAARAIGHTDPRKALTELVAALDRPQARVRAAAAAALGPLQRNEAIESLLRLLAREDEAAVGDVALASLMQFEPRQLAPAIDRAMNGDPAMRRAALRVVRQRPDALFRLAVFRGMLDASLDPALLREGIVVLGELGGTEAQRVIRQHATHPDPIVRARAIERLTPVDEASWWSLVRDRLADEDAAVRDAAFAAFERADVGRAPGGVLELLRTPLHSDRPEIVKRAIVALRNHLDADSSLQALAVLAPVLGGAEDELRQLAASALAPHLDNEGRQQLAAAQGFVTRWQVVLPFPSDAQMGGLDIAYPPESGFDPAAAYRVEGMDEDDPPLQWTSLTTYDHEGNLLFSQGGAEHENKVAYAYARLDSPRAQSVVFDVIPDGDARLWLNGKLLGGARYRETNRLAANLQPGVNALLVKVANQRGPWYVAVRVLDAERSAPAPFREITPP